MSNPYLLTFLAASTTVFGGIFSLFFKKNDKAISLMLSVSAGIMIFLSFFEILPKAISSISENQWIVSYSFGLFLIIFIDKITSSIGHGFEKGEKIGFYSFLLIMIHNIPEGLSVFASSIQNIDSSMIWAIALHNFPEGIIVAAPIYALTKDIKKTIIFL